MTTYYLSNSGSDTATGTSEATPWATLARLNTALLSGIINRSDSVLLRRGDKFHGSIMNIPAPSPGAKSRLVIGGYGYGPKPIMSGYKGLNIAGSWVLHSAGVWKIDLSNVALFTGNTMTTNANTGFLKVDGRIKVAKKWSVATLVDQWDFYSDTTTLYVKSTANPTTLASDIQAAVDRDGIRPNAKTLVSGLDILGFGGHAVNIPSIDDCEVIGCDLHEIGGSKLGASDLQYGNGIQVWIGASNVLCHFNNVYDVYEVAFTMQGPQDATLLGWTDVHFTHNKMWNNGQSFETWATGTNFAAGTGFVRCSFTDNVCINAGYAWSESQKTQAGIGTHLLNYHMQLPTDLKIKRNVFFDAVDNYFFKNTGAIPAGYDVDENTIFLRPRKKVQHQSSQTIENFQAWVAATGMDRNSTWVTIPDSVTSLDDASSFIAAHGVREAASSAALERATGVVLADTVAKSERAQQRLDAALAPATRLATPLLGTQSYAQGGAVTSIANAAAPEGSLQGWVMTPARTCILGKIAVHVQTAGSAGAVVRLALYEITLGAVSAQGILLTDAGTVDATTTGSKFLTISQQVEVGKNYLVAAVGQGGATTAAIVATSQGIDAAIGGSDSVQLTARLMGYQVAGVTGAAPASPTFVGSGNVIRTVVAASS